MKKFLIVLATVLLMIFSGQVDVNAANVQRLDNSVQLQELGPWTHFRDKHLRHKKDKDRHHHHHHRDYYYPPPPPPRYRDGRRYDPPPPPPRYRDDRHYYDPPPPPPRYRDDDRYYYGPPPRYR